MQLKPKLKRVGKKLAHLTLADDPNDKTAIGKMGLEQTYTQVMENEKGGKK